MCNGKNGLGEQIKVIPSGLGNFLIGRKQTAELKPVARHTEMHSTKWLCTLSIMWPADQSGLMVGGFWEEENNTVENTPWLLQQSCDPENKRLLISLGVR